MTTTTSPHRRRAVLALGILAVVAALLPVGGRAAAADDSCTKTWSVTEPDGGDDWFEWTDGDAWSPTGVPTATDVVCLPAGQYGVGLVLGDATVEAVVVGDDTADPQPRLFVAGGDLVLTAADAGTNFGSITVGSPDIRFAGSSIVLDGGSFTNRGSLSISGGTGPAALVNTGISGGGAGGELLHQGTMAASGWASLRCLSFASSGAISVASGGTLRAHADCADASVDLSGGAVQTAGSFVVEGALTVAGTTELAGPLPLDSTGGSLGFADQPNGTVRAWGSTLAGTIPQGIELRVDRPTTGADAQVTLGGPTDNQGRIVLDRAQGTAASTLDLDGFALESTGDLVLGATTDGARRIESSTAADLAAKGEVLVESAAGELGCVDLAVAASGTLTVAPDGALAATCAEAAVTSDGTVSVAGVLAAPVALDAGHLSGAGSVAGVVTHTGGVLAPGGAAGRRLTIDGAYSGSGDAVLAVGYDGAPDELVVTGSASIGGQLSVTATVVPVDPAALLTAEEVDGTFDSVEGVPAGWIGYSQTQVTLAAVPSFSDVGVDHPFFLDIEWAVGAGIVRGYDDDTFRPTAGASRQAVVAMLYREAGSPEGADPVCDEPPFVDVPVGQPFCGEIAWAAELGLVRGWEDGTFRPTLPVSRQALVTITYRLAGSPEGADPVCDEPPFVDVPVGQPFCGEIAWAAEEGITTGFDDGTFRPIEPVSRQATTAFLRRLRLLG